MAFLTKKADPAKATKNSKQELATIPSQTIAKSGTTRVVIKYDAGYPNQLYIRGEGSNLSWQKGLPLKNVKADEWVWETSLPFSQCKFKVLINDQIYETGENHSLTQGSSTQYTPYFPK